MSTSLSPPMMEGCTLYAESRRYAPAPPSGVSTLADLLQHQAAHHTNAPLLSFRPTDGTAVQTWSYEQVYTQSTALAHSLHPFAHASRQQDGPSVVGIWFEKSIELHLAIFATTLAGATWLPFDPDAPVGRINACLNDSHATVLLCDEQHYSSALEAAQGTSNTQVIHFQHLLQAARLPSQRPCLPMPQDVAYMIYTSGSTGTPKGIAISHQAALTFALSEQTVLQTNDQDVVWQGFSPAFDMFIEEVWVSIVGGAHLIVGSRQECQNVPGLGGARGVWASRGVTVINAVPTLINIMTSLVDEEGQSGVPASVRLLNLGGEACPAALVKRLWRPSLRIVNTYGPSETTVTATFQELLPDQEVTIGKPLPSYHALVLPIADDYEGTGPAPTAPLTLKPGIEGELAIGGSCLGEGYVGRAELTAEKFIRHPFNPNERLYRTGDRVRLDKSLNILFCGRIDTQVKHRGFRIELGEIENALSLHAQIQTCAVILSSARSQLEAYIVAKNDVAAIDVKELRQTLAALPAYMQPAAYLFLKADEMPRLPSGKINAKALQDVSKANAEARSHAMEDFVEDEGSVDPSSELGVLLSALRHTFPDAVSIQPTSDFFDDLGGHSLAAATLVSYIRRTCPDSASALRSLSLQDIYLLKTAEAIIAKYKDTMRTSEEHEDEELLMYKAEKGDCVSAARSGGPSGVQTGEHWPVSQTRFVLCGVAQVPALIFIWFLQSIQFLLPYLCFVALRDLTHDVGFAILAAYGALVVTPIFLFFVALAGKWLVLGMAEPGEYPLYGVYYYRWWFSVRLLEMIDLGTLAETPIIATLWRLAGARIGKHCHIAGILMSCPDLVCIGDDVVLSAHVKLDTAYVERGRLILKPITIGSGARIGTNCLIEGGAVVEADAELVRMTMVPDGVRIPAAQRWHGSPATYLDEVKDVGLERRTRPSQVRFLLTGFLLSFLTVFVLPMVYLAPQIPILLLFEFVDIKHLSRAWAQIAIMALPGSMAYIAMVFIEMVALRWIVLGRVKEGTYSTTSLFFVRKWFVDRIMAISLLVLHAVYATLYVIPYLRALGVKIGDRAEVSTATGINFNLTEIGDESFVADRVYIGPVEVRANAFTLRRTTFEKRAFAGNSSIVPQGTTLHSETLVGVLSVAPDPDHGTPMKNGQSCFGSPPVLMPARQAAKVCHPDHKLFAPFRSQIALRLFIEGARIILPRVVVVFGIGFSMSIFQVAYPHIGIVRAAVMLPIYHLIMFCLPALAIVVACKWVLIGRYRPAEWPLWSNEVWRSEFVTSTYEALVAPTFTNKLVGTPYLAMCFRLLGVKIGKRVTLLHNDMTEYDMITLGDESVLNANSGCQTHLFEDRVMKIAYVTLGKRAVLKSYSICLPGSHVQEGGQVGSLSLVMKGETVPAGQAWEGAPIVPRPKRQRGAFSSPIYPKATKETGSPSHSAEVTELTRFTEHTNFTVSSFPKSSFTFAPPVIASSATTQIDV